MIGNKLKDRDCVQVNHNGDCCVNCVNFGKRMKTAFGSFKQRKGVRVR
jgi:hypothetical protein